MEKHTKGEWILNESRSEIVSSNDCSKNGGIDIIAQCFCGFNHESTMNECKANAKLIAAAPELLEACLKLIEWNKKYPPNKIYSWGKGKAIEEELTEIVNEQIEAINKATK